MFNLLFVVTTLEVNESAEDVERLRSDVELLRNES